MLDFVYYPVSALLLFWHNVFSFVVGDPSSGLAWSLAVIFLVFTVRLLLVRPFVKQVRTQRITRQLQPEIKALREKYSGDNRRLAEELQKLNKEHGVNALAGCLPALVQAPVFIGLFHVLRSFDRTGTAAHVPFLDATDPMSAAQNAVTPNYFFSAADVQSFLDAHVFGAPLSAVLTAAWSPAVLAVAVPLMVLSAVATFVTTRVSLAHQDPVVADTAQGRIMNRVMMVVPLGVLVGGPFVPVAILIYFLANNAWTALQQWVVFRRLSAAEPADASGRG
ncbi:membrane protein OxaA [Rhodococcoides trifolii]|uniref:Membrane protein insertase YidC n=1 Tax=Rhodococcoides trifolii TaxID=908250 RepID=A0A917FKN4_9NOCA|nr:membrane protein insertase YidC [Rhodococcus trifolii]GGF90847.1 membrane protein OxaA [Rhodococcus trifolii]